MPKIANAYGLVLMILGAFGYMQGESKSMTALIPAFIGLPIILCGIGSLLKHSLRPHLMHLACVFALIGASAIFMGIMKVVKGGFSLGPAMMIMTGLFSIGFLVLAINSFRAARKAKEAKAAKAAAATNGASEA